MSEILLAKPILPPDFIDLSVGEAHVVREALYSVFDIESYQMGRVPDMEYPYPSGYEPLVKLLEDKHQAPVVITNGAKNALAAVMFALQQMGKKTIGMRSPHWTLIPPLLKMYGLDYVDANHPVVYFDSNRNFDSYLCVSPNNPDGHTLPSKGLCDVGNYLKRDAIPLIHDAVYYNHVYLPTDYQLNQFGDVQIYSASKSFGLSGIRIGWAVCPNKEMYKLIQYYMETMTVGVSVLSQAFIYDLMSQMKLYPLLTTQFEKTAALSLMRSKELMLQVSPNVLEVPSNLLDIPGMFLFCKVKDYSLLEKAKINAIDGKHFGAPGYVRFNLALPGDQIKEVVRRLNNV